MCQRHGTLGGASATEALFTYGENLGNLLTHPGAEHTGCVGCAAPRKHFSRFGGIALRGCRKEVVSRNAFAMAVPLKTSQPLRG